MAGCKNLNQPEAMCKLYMMIAIVTCHNGNVQSKPATPPVYLFSFSHPTWWKW